MLKVFLWIMIAPFILAFWMIALPFKLIGWILREVGFVMIWGDLFD